MDITGVALATNTVFVNGDTNLYRKVEYFRKELSMDTSPAPVWQLVTVSGVGEPSVTGNVFVPKTNEVFTYDRDGNLTGDGPWTFEWDAENRLVRVRAYHPVLSCPIGKSRGLMTPKVAESGRRLLTAAAATGS
ncbi:MAG: hypothetical protein RMN51_11685 [Verrucomicrobiota bacterium]|nr:hypothetical protein [Verrucomicrobiota bacterium]